MSVEKLMVKLEADVKDYVSDLEKADKANKDAGTSGKVLAGSLSKIGAGATAVAVPIAGFAAGVVALGSALSALTLNAASNRRDLERYARQAKTSTSEFQALSFATKQYGLEADSVADITKDLSDRFGEFATAGSGAFQDFADVMGMSAEEAQKAAVEFGNMSGEDAMLEIVRQMEDAGASGSQMTFVLESLGSELSRLLPLLTDNGKELARMKGRYGELSTELALSSQQAEDLKDVSESFDLMSDAIDLAGAAIGARFAPILDGLINTVISVVPKATNTIIDFFNSFVAADKLASLRDVNAQIKKVNEDILADEKKMEEGRHRGETQTRKNLADNRQKLKELQDQLKVIEEQNKQYELQQAIQRKNAEIKAGTTSGGSITNLDEENELKAEKLKEQQALELEQQLAFLMTKEEATIASYIRELELIEEYGTALGASDEQLYNRRLEAAKKFRDKMVGLKKDEAKGEENKQKDIEFSMKDGVRVASQVGQLLFEDNKAVKAGLIIADTAAAIMGSLSRNPYDWGNVAAIAATGVVQLANALSATKGGGSLSGNAGGGGTQITNAPEEFRPDTTDLDIGTTIEDGDNFTQRVTLDVDSSEDFIDTLADRISQRTRAM